MSKIEVQTIDAPSGQNTVTIGDSNASTITLKSGATLTNFPNNTPSFAARMSSAQSISNNTLTKIDFDTEEFDSDGAYDHSTNQRFTVPSGKAGKYVFYTSAILDAASHTQLQRCRIAIYKNGSMVKMRAVNFNSNDIYYMQLDISATLDLSAGDYIEAYARINDDSGNPVIDGSATENSTFYGYRLA
jgi:hypothetical protein